MRRTALSLVLVLLSISAASAESLRLTVLDLSGAKRGAPDRTFDGRCEVVASLVGSTPAEEHRVNVARGQSTFSLPPGLWRVVVRSDGYWGLPEEVRLSDTADSTTERALALRVWKAGTIAGSLAGADGPLPTTLRLDLQSAPDQGVVPHSVVECPVRGPQWTCEVPAETLDLQLRVSDYIPHYRWGVNVPPAKIARLEALALRRGASLAGFVETDGGIPAVGARAELVSPAGDPIPSQPGGARQSSFVAVTNERGFFQLAPVPPADHLIVARRAPFADAQAPVRILKGLEARLAQPLYLRPAVTLDVFISPAQDPWGGPWIIQLRSNPPSGRAQLLGRAQSVPEDGHWQRKGVSAGTYSAMLSSSTGVRWVDHPFVLGDTPEPVSITLSSLGVEGTVKLGGQPLQAKVVFGGERGSVRVPLTANEQGEFEGLLPEVSGATARTWDVFVESDDPPVHRLVEGVEVTVVPGLAKARVDIDLPATEIEGDGLDEATRPFDGHALISAQHAEGDEPTQIQIGPGDKGHFKLMGLRPGAYRVRAQARSATAQGVPLQSDEVPVVAREGTRPSPVRLILRDSLMVSGRVVTMDGTGIPGIRVSVAAPQSPVVRTLVTDAEGRFKHPLPRGTVAVGLTAGAPGLGYYLGLVPVDQRGEATVRLERGGGTLNLEIPATEDPSESPYLIKDGFYAGIAFLTSVGGLGGAAADQGRITLSPLAGGRYVLCMARFEDLGALTTTPDPSRCRSGSLAAAGVLSLRLPSRPGKEGVKAGEKSR